MQDARKSVGNPPESAFSVWNAAFEGISDSMRFTVLKARIFEDLAKRSTLSE